MGLSELETARQGNSLLDLGDRYYVGCMHGVLFNALHCLIENQPVLPDCFWPLSCSFLNSPTIRILGVIKAICLLHCASW